MLQRKEGGGEEGMHVFIEGLQGAENPLSCSGLQKDIRIFILIGKGTIALWSWHGVPIWIRKPMKRYLRRSIPSLEEEIRRWTVREEGRFIVQYTRILTDTPGFHKDMERSEIYNGSVDGKTFPNHHSAAL